VNRAERDRLRAEAAERIELARDTAARPNIVLAASEVVAICDALDEAEKALVSIKLLRDDFASAEARDMACAIASDALARLRGKAT
jgi:hypothetical protein